MSVKEERALIKMMAQNIYCTYHHRNLTFKVVPSHQVYSNIVRYILMIVILNFTIIYCGSRLIMIIATAVLANHSMHISLNIKHPSWLT